MRLVVSVLILSLISAVGFAAEKGTTGGKSLAWTEILSHKAKLELGLAKELSTLIEATKKGKKLTAKQSRQLATLESDLKKNETSLKKIQERIPTLYVTVEVFEQTNTEINSFTAGAMFGVFWNICCAPGETDDPTDDPGGNGGRGDGPTSGGSGDCKGVSEAHSKDCEAAVDEMERCGLMGSSGAEIEKLECQVGELTYKLSCENAWSETIGFDLNIPAPNPADHFKWNSAQAERLCGLVGGNQGEAQTQTPGGN